MQKIKFDVGNEEIFFEFINGISENDKTALITHTDLDGITSAKIVESVVNIDMLKFVNYDEIKRPLIEELKKQKITKVIFTDICLRKEIVKKINEFAKILIIDHHLIEEDFNSEDVVYLDVREYCASYLCYVLFSKIKNLEKLDWLVTCACIADFQFFKNQDFMKEVYNKYGDEFVIENNFIRKSGKIYYVENILVLTLIYFAKDLQKAYDLISEDLDRVNYLKKYGNEVQKEIDESIELFDKEKEVYGDIYFWEFNPKFMIKSIVVTLVSIKEYDKTFIFGRPNTTYYNLSVRRQDKKVNTSDLLKKLLEGFEDASCGGHIASAGGHFLIKYLPEFKKRLEKFT